MPVPIAVTRWFASTYPHTALSSDWLEECYAFLAAKHPGSAAPALLKKVEHQLLMSDLADSTTHHDGLFPDNDGQSRVLFQNGRHGVLVQVIEVLEIGRPALELLDIHKNRIEDKKVFKEQGIQVRRAIAHVEDPTQNGGGGGGGDLTQQQAQAEDAKPTVHRGFPRSMLRLKVSDGFTEYSAIECKKVSDVSLEDTPLGCKLLLKNIRCLRGILMLDDQTCTVMGGRIAELDDDRDERLRDLLERRVRGDDGNAAPPHDPVPVHAAPARQQNAQPQQARHAAPPRAPPPKSPRTKSRPAKAAKKEEDADDFDALIDDDDIDEDAMAILQATEADDRDVKPTTSRQQARPAKGKGRLVKDESFEYDDDEEVWASAEAAAEAPAEPSRRPKSEPPGQLGFISNAQKAPGRSKMEVIELGNSSSDEEVAAQMIPTKRSRSKVKREHANQPIEID